jgi:hypothetical protein
MGISKLKSIPQTDDYRFSAINRVVVNSGGTANVWRDILNINGQGYLLGAIEQFTGNWINSVGRGIRVKIDGVTVFEAVMTHGSNGTMPSDFTGVCWIDLYSSSYGSTYRKAHFKIIGIADDVSTDKHASSVDYPYSNLNFNTMYAPISMVSIPVKFNNNLTVSIYGTSESYAKCFVAYSLD